MWDELVARWYVGDFFRPTEAVRRYYEVKNHIVERLRPTSICEIGVRAGYSAFAFLSAVPDAEYLGIDKGVGDPHEAAAYAIHAQQILAGFNVRMLPVDSATLRELPRTGQQVVPGTYRTFDLVHIDGDHSYAGCRRDLELAINAAYWVLVDDFDVGPEIRKACHDVMLERPDLRAEYIPDGLRGNLLLTYHRL